jgi:prepilin-type N-terminal cleavage/methylation domain-containing protein
MKKLKASLLAFTLIELLVVISIISILASLAIPAISRSLVRGSQTQTLANMRQLFGQTAAMYLDSQKTSDTNIGWPGDLPDPTFAGWVAKMVPDYLTTNDMAKYLSAPGIPVATNADFATLTPGAAKNGRAILLYKVGVTNALTTVMFSSSNFTNAATLTTPISPDSLPYGDQGFIVYRKDNTCNIFQKAQSTNVGLVGEFAEVQN